jgi:tRNA threonylcarbamoyladenosine biosynthesis protein TsaB
MPSLRQLIDAHAPLLVIDAASTKVQAGWITENGISEAKWATSNEDTGVGLFRSIEALDVEIGAARGFVFCEGPGSVLGIRTCAMALRTWHILEPRPVFSYCSIALVAHSHGRTDLGVIADARRELWHHFSIGGKLRRVSAADLSGALVMPENFRHWSLPPSGVSEVAYSLAELLPSVYDRELFQPTETPDAFLHEEPSYVTWTPKIHRPPAI